jgi:flagellar FliJ protein
MAQSKYGLLFNLSQEKVDAAAERMRRAQGQYNTAQNKQTQLMAFLAEYQGRLKNGGVRGMGIGQWRDFQQFLLRLQEAVTIQQGEVERCLQRLMMERAHWQDERKKLKAYEKLIEREREAAQRAESRRAQKLTDEFASRKFWDESQGND